MSGSAGAWSLVRAHTLLTHRCASGCARGGRVEMMCEICAHENNMATASAHKHARFSDQKFTVTLSLCATGPEAELPSATRQRHASAAELSSDRARRARRPVSCSRSAGLQLKMRADMRLAWRISAALNGPSVCSSMRVTPCRPSTLSCTFGARCRHAPAQSRAHSYKDVLFMMLANSLREICAGRIPTHTQRGSSGESRSVSRRLRGWLVRPAVQHARTWPS